MARRGFTLVELSIVLVIIGLLIGGILVAQSMISTAQIQNVIRQLQQYDTAINNFATKYNQLPGDSSLFPVPGDNNGHISNSETATTEWGNFWAHLSLGVSLKNAQGTDYVSFDTTTDPVTSLNIPQFNAKQDKTDFPCLTGAYVDWGYGFKNYLSYESARAAIVGLSKDHDPLPPATALVIDIKIDDAKPYTGTVISSEYGALTIGDCVNGGSDYDVGNVNPACSMLFQLKDY